MTPLFFISVVITLIIVAYCWHSVFWKDEINLDGLNEDQKKSIERIIATPGTSWTDLCENNIKEAERRWRYHFGLTDSEPEWDLSRNPILNQWDLSVRIDGKKYLAPESIIQQLDHLYGVPPIQEALGTDIVIPPLKTI